MISLDQGGAARGGVRTFDVPPDLRDHIESISVHQYDVPPHGPWRVIPDASAHIVWHRTRNGEFRAVLVGPRSTYIDVDARPRAQTGGIRFRPGALPTVLQEDAGALTDRQYGLEEVWGRAGTVAFERAATAPDSADAVSALVSLIQPSGPVDWRTRGLLHHFVREPRVSFAGVAGRLGVSERSLRDHARRTLGLRPKRAQRVMRVQRAIAKSLDGSADSSAAAAAGYADQSHFIREASELLGETPRRFRTRGRVDSGG